VIVEGYNESRQLGTGQETMEALRKQDFPLDHVEVVLVGSVPQTREWQRLYAGETAFFAVRTVAFESAHYYELKNGGAEIASGEIIAFTDSDVLPKPGWLSAIVEGIGSGADVVVGPSLFRQTGGLSPDAPLMRVLASITWGWVVGKHKNGSHLRAVGFMDHNVALRTEVFRTHQYRTDFGRIIASPLLYRSLADARCTIALQPEQQASHHFSWRYWLIKLHFRYGYEVFQLRRLDKQYPNQWIAQSGVLEPLVTMMWHVLLDIPRWFRFSGLLRTHLLCRLALLPMVVALSSVARASEMVGMYCTMIDPARMKQWAETV
jgi:glycosyltransferase involved in cell wall biosynthesis